MLDSEMLHETPLELLEQQTLDVVPSADLPALLEALLLVAPEPVSSRDLASASGVSIATVESVLDAMNDDPNKGWIVVRHNGVAHLSSAPRFAVQVRRLLRLDRESRLSGAALETLALIAYRQPVTRSEIDALRGVDSSGVLATLHARGLIEIAGRLPTVGNPLQYATTFAFLRQFGLSSLSDLPPLNELHGDASSRVFEEIPVELPARDAGFDQSFEPV